MTSDKKTDLIHSILRNDAHPPESRLYQRLEVVLNQLSTDVVEDLSQLMNVKLNEARDEGRGSA